MFACLLLVAAPAAAKGKKKGRRFLKSVPDRRAFDSLAERQAESFAQGTAELKFLVSKPRGTPACWFFNSPRLPWASTQPSWATISPARKRRLLVK